MSAQQRAPGWLTILRDFTAFTFPWVLIFKQAGIMFPPPQEVSEPILWLAGAMLGVPGVAQILAFRFGGGTGMDDSRPPDRSPVLPPSDTSSSTSSRVDASESVA